MTAPSTAGINTLSLHDALPIWMGHVGCGRYFEEVRALHEKIGRPVFEARQRFPATLQVGKRCRADRKSTRLNSSHPSISYAVFCLKKNMLCHVLCFDSFPLRLS